MGGIRGVGLRMNSRHKMLLGAVLAAEPVQNFDTLMALLFGLRERLKPLGAAFYDFVWCDSGPWSFTAEHDVQRLRREGLLDEASLSVPSGMRRQAINQLRSLDDTVRMEITIGQTGVVKRSMTSPRDGGQAGFKPGHTSIRHSVFTKGYEGLSIELFIRSLRQAEIACVVDVRKNPVSRKYGFSKSSLSRALGIVGMEYRHMPRLGIPSAKRKGLESDADYRALFRYYRTRILADAGDALDAAIDVVQRKKSCLMCYEQDPQKCHRTYLAEAIAAASGLPVVNL